MSVSPSEITFRLGYANRPDSDTAQSLFDDGRGVIDTNLYIIQPLVNGVPPSILDGSLMIDSGGSPFISRDTVGSSMLSGNWKTNDPTVAGTVCRVKVSYKGKDTAFYVNVFKEKLSMQFDTTHPFTYYGFNNVVASGATWLATVQAVISVHDGRTDSTIVIPKVVRWTGQNYTTYYSYVRPYPGSAMTFPLIVTATRDGYYPAIDTLTITLR